MDTKINGNNYTINCQSLKTRNGFKHVCYLTKNNSFDTIETVKINYINRTWEPWQYRSCIYGLIDKFLKSTKNKTISVKKIMLSIDKKMQGI
jgi:hypothetical protein